APNCNFPQVVHRCLKEDGMFLLHTIKNNSPNIPYMIGFFDKYIFPNGCMPYYIDIVKSTEGLQRFIIEDWHNFGTDYAKNLVWKENFDKNWPNIAEKYGEKFYRLWTFYLFSCPGYFTSRKGQLWQIILTKGVESGYRS